MEPKIVIVTIDLFKQPGFNEEFRYRAFVNNELFTERTWIWDDQSYLEENLQILAPPGEYKIHFTVHNASPEVLEIKNIRVVDGPGKIKNDHLIIK